MTKSSSYDSHAPGKELRITTTDVGRTHSSRRAKEVSQGCRAKFSATYIENLASLALRWADECVRPYVREIDFAVELSHDVLAAAFLTCSSTTSLISSRSSPRNAGSLQPACADSKGAEQFYIRSRGRVRHVGPPPPFTQSSSPGNVRTSNPASRNL